MGPPLPSVQSGFLLTSAVARPAIQVEMFLDLICPFSCKMWKAVYKDVLPKCGDKVGFVINQVPQPWHPQGTYVHEAALAVKDVAPSAYPAYVDAIYTAYSNGRFKDAACWDMTRQQIYEELLALIPVTPECSAVDASAVAERLAAKPENAGTAMTQHIKWAVKYHRCRGVHVTPTVHVNGLEAGVVSSGWTGEQWLKFLEAEGSDFFQGNGI